MNIVTKVDDRVKVRNVLLSVYDKEGLGLIAGTLLKTFPDVRFFSTGGTYRRLAELLGEEVAHGHLVRVSDYTRQPETQGGLVKTLDFKIYLGLLTETYNDEHRADMARTDSVPIDMVVCNLYPFEATVAGDGVTVEEARANIDIGGPTMIRAAAKNFIRVATVVEPGDYQDVCDKLREGGGALSLEMRYWLACRAFDHTAAYDNAISAFLHGKLPSDASLCYETA